MQGRNSLHSLHPKSLSDFLFTMTLFWKINSLPGTWVSLLRTSPASAHSYQSCQGQLSETQVCSRSEFSNPSPHITAQIPTIHMGCPPPHYRPSAWSWAAVKWALPGHGQESKGPTGLQSSLPLVQHQVLSLTPPLTCSLPSFSRTFFCLQPLCPNLSTAFLHPAHPIHFSRLLKSFLWFPPVINYFHRNFHYI